MQVRDAFKSQSVALSQPESSKAISGLSIFKKPRAAMTGSISSLKSSTVYDGIGGTTKVLQSDLKKTNSIDSFWSASSKPSNANKKKKLSPTALSKHS